MSTVSDQLHADHDQIAQSVTSLTVFDSLEDAERDWRALLDVATASPYQRYEIQAAWFDTVGRALRLEPFIIVARDRAKAPVAVLPFAISTFGPLRIAHFIGNRENNFGLGLFAPGFRDPHAAQRLLVDAARQTARGPDLYHLKNAPRRFDGAGNPLAFADAPDSPSYGYGVTLPDSLEALSARLSKDTRKKLRKKEAWLTEVGPINYEHRPTGARARVVLDALIAQKSARLAEMGVAPLASRPGMRAFLERATDEGALELHALAAGERIVATYAGFAHNGRFSALLNSFDMDEKIARSSPGDLLLQALMRDLVSRNFTRFDLGVGEARYKQSVSDETIEMCEAVVAVSVKGVLVAPLLTLGLQAKRRLKRSPALSHALARLRRLVS